MCSILLAHYSCAEEYYNQHSSLNPKNAINNFQYCVVARFIGRFLKPPMNRQTTEKFNHARR